LQCASRALELFKDQDSIMSMCEICKKHAGKKSTWYFNPKNFSREMGEARKEILEKIADEIEFEKSIITDFGTIESLKTLPVVNKIARNLGERVLKETQGGQVIPLEDAIKVLKLCENPTILPCLCRQMAGEERYCCLNFGLIPELYKKANPDEYMEEVSLTTAERLLRDWDKEGLYHVILWGKVPYVTCICNCTASYCVAYKGRYESGLQHALIKGEYVVRVNQERCRGCKTCLTRCQFGAVSFNVDHGKAFVDIRKCTGCGLCLSGCSNNAIQIIERQFTPAKALW
jgi:ferredoxin